MQKDFDRWNKIKKHLDASTNRFYRIREIWWCNLGLNIGNEQNGNSQNFQRPVLILKSLSKTTCVIVPLTTSIKKHRHRIFIGNISGKSASVIISQIKVIDTKRLINKINSKLEVRNFNSIRKAVRQLF